MRRSSVATAWRLRRLRLRRLYNNEFLRHSALIFASTTLVNLFGYSFHFLLSRRLGVSDYGTLSSLLAFLAITTVPATIVTTIVVKYTAEFTALGDEGKARALAGRTFLALSIVGLIALAAVVAGSGLIAAYLHVSDRVSVITSAYTLAVALVLPGMRGVLQGVQDFSAFAASTLIEAIGKVLVATLLVYHGYGVAGALIGYGAASTVSLAYTVFRVFGSFSEASAKLMLDLRRLAQSTSGIAGTTLAISMLGFMDVLLIKHFFPARVAGLYGAASLMGKMLLFAVSFIPTIVLPKATAKAIAGESPRRLLVQAGALATAMCVIGLLSFGFFGGDLLKLTLGRDFGEAMPYVLPCALIMSILGIIGIASTYKIGLHRFNFVLPICLVAVIEIVAIYRWHGSVFEVLAILLAGHGLALSFTLYRIFDPIQSAPLETGEAGAVRGFAG